MARVIAKRRSPPRRRDLSEVISARFRVACQPFLVPATSAFGPGPNGNHPDCGPHAQLDDTESPAPPGSSHMHGPPPALPPDFPVLWLRRRMTMSARKVSCAIFPRPDVERLSHEYQVVALVSARPLGDSKLLAPCCASQHCLA